MAALGISASSIVGVNLSRMDGTQAFPTGTIVNLTDGGQAMYVKASASALSTYAACSINKAGVATMLTTTNAPNSARVGFAQVSIATSDFGWVRLGGSVLVNLLTQAAPNVPLFSTSTAGNLDDATVTNGYIAGLTNQTSISNATASTCIGAYPHIVRYGGGA